MKTKPTIIAFKLFIFLYLKFTFKRRYITKHKNTPWCTKRYQLKTINIGTFTAYIKANKLAASRFADFCASAAIQVSFFLGMLILLLILLLACHEFCKLMVIDIIIRIHTDGLFQMRLCRIKPGFMDKNLTIKKMPVSCFVADLL